MKNLKNIFAAIILLSTLTTTITASTSNEIEINYCFDDATVLTLEIPELGVNEAINLLQSTYDATVTIQLTNAEGSIIEIDIDGTTALIRAYPINARAGITGDGINALITGDGINARGITGDGINALIRGDGINPLISSDGINVHVSQSGTSLFSQTF